MGTKLTIEEMQRIAAKQGGKCLSKEYFNNITKLKWECNRGHQWERSYSDMKHRDNWCRDCELLKNKQNKKVE